jgi:hypothetical protein
MLALGVWDGPPGCWLYVLPLASMESFVAIAHKGVTCTNATVGADNPDEEYRNCVNSFVPNIPAFATLGIATIFIFLKATATVVSLAIGIVSSVVLTLTGL